MYLQGARGQQQTDTEYDYSGTITTGGTPQLLLPQSKSRTKLLIVNNSTGTLNIAIGLLPAKATITNGVVTGVTVPDVGFGFNAAPDILFLGGGNANDPQSYGATMPDWPAPFNPAVGAAVMGSSSVSGLNISSITIQSGGSGYLAAPYVKIMPKRYDPTGVGLASASVGFTLGANGGSYYVNGTACSCDAISVYGATTGQAYTCKWML